MSIAAMLVRNVERAVAPKSSRRDDDAYLKTLGHLALVRVRDDHPTPVEALFQARKSAEKSNREVRVFL